MDSTDCSEPASSLTVKPGPPRTPAKPVAAYHLNPNAVRLTWASPGGGEEAFIASYRVTPTPADGLTGSCMTLVTVRTCDFEGLESGTSYTFRVVANGITTGTVTTGTSAASPASDAIVAGPPGTPLNAAAVYAADESLTLTWDEPDSGAPVGRYTVTSNQTVDSTELSDCGADKDVRTCTFTELDASLSYTFQVTAVGDGDGSGASSPSVASEAIIPGKPWAPGTPFAELGAAEGEVTVSWEAPEGGPDPTSYTVTAIPATGQVLGTPSEDCGVDPDERICQFTGLAPGVSYTFKVRAVTVDGGTDSAPSDPVVSEAPATPATPQVVLGNAPGTATVTWTAPTSGGAVNSYVVTAVAAGGGAAGTKVPGCGFNLAAPSCSFTDLDPTKSYTFVVTAIGDLGSRDSDPSLAVIPDKPGKSSKPSVVLGSASGTATVSWNEPSDRWCGHQLHGDRDSGRWR